MRIAQLSDIHVFDSEGLTMSDFLTKRIVGGVNLATGRRNSHPLDLAERLIEDVTMQDIDHVVVTGDVTNLSLPGEFQRAYRLLRIIGDHQKLTVVPGNHDVYTKGAERQQRFENFFGDILFGPNSTPENWVYPAIKDLGDVVVIGLSSALATGLLSSWGRIGNDQMKRLDQALETAEFENKFKIALVHHNIHKRDLFHEQTSALKDRDELIQTLLKHNVHLLLHGHTHRANRFTVSRDEHTMAIMGSGSSTQNSSDPERMARYNIYTIDDGLQRVRTRVYDSERRRFEWLV